MSLLETLKTRLIESRRAGNTVAMGVLQVVLGDASMIEARTGKKASDDEIEKLIRKTLLGNQETMELLEQKGQKDSEMYGKLRSESDLLQSLLPKTLDVKEIVTALTEIADTLKTAKNEGQATGQAMKHLKSKGLRVLGEDVAVAVKQIRS